MEIDSRIECLSLTGRKRWIDEHAGMERHETCKGWNGNAETRMRGTEKK